MTLAQFLTRFGTPKLITMKKIFALLALTSFISLTVLAGEPAKTCDKKEGKSCCAKKEASAGKSCCSKDASAAKSCSKEKSSCSHDKDAKASDAKTEVKSDK